MKYIKVPEDITLRDELTDERVKSPDGKEIPPMKFKEFVANTVCRHDERQFCTDADGIFSRKEIVAIVKGSNPGDWIGFESADYDRLLKAANTPTVPYHGFVASCCSDFIKAIRKAEDKRPEEDKKPDAAKEEARASA